MKLPDKITGFRSRVINDIIDFIQSLQPIRSSTVRHTWTKQGVAYDVQTSLADVGLDVTNFAFGVTCSGNTFTVQTGTVYIWNKTKYEDVGGDYEYTDASEYVWICVQIFITSATTPVIVGLSAIPEINSSYIYVPLARFRSDDNGETYVQDGNGWILKIGDIHLPGPIVWQ